MKKPRPPKRVKILGKWYSIKASLGFDEDIYGMCKTEKQIIQYFSGLHADQLRDTIWHEILHAIYHETGLSYQISDKEEESPTEEQLVRRSATVELQVLRENPSLVNFLVED